MPDLTAHLHLPHAGARDDAGAVHAALAAALEAVRAAEQQIERQRRMLEQNQKLSALGAMMGGLAHDLNNPLSIVIGQSQLLLETSSDARTVQRAEKISHAAERCAKIVNSFLAAAREEPPQQGLVQLNDVVRAVLELLDAELYSRGVEVHTELADQLPPLLADFDQLHQVVSNLVINAFHAMEAVPQRRLAVSTRARDGAIELAIADSGPGVPAEIRDQIFEPFFTTKPEGHGTGLGLPVCLAILEAHGATIALQDREPGGACFVIDFVAASGQEQGQPPAFVLLVEPDPLRREQMREPLARAGYTVLCVSDPSAAIELERAPDLVLCALSLPVAQAQALRAQTVGRWQQLERRFVHVADHPQQAPGRDMLVLEQPFSPEPFLSFIHPLLRAPGP